MKHLVLLIVNVICLQPVASSFVVLNRFAPVEIREFKNIGSQENFFWSIPAKYSAFYLEWGFFSSTDDGGAKSDCADVLATVVVDRWGIPISNPLNTTYPDNTYTEVNETVTETTVIYAAKNNSMLMKFLDRDSVDEDFYAAVYINSGSGDSSVGGNCNYFVSLKVGAFLPEQSSNNTSTYESVFDFNNAVVLPRYELGFLQTLFKTRTFGYNISTLSNKTFAWDIEHFIDTGGTMLININIEKQNMTQQVFLSGQMYWQQVNMGKSYNLEVLSKDGNKSSGRWYWPYPKAGKWGIEVSVKCDNSSCDDVNFTFAVMITPCIDSCQSSNYHGDCKLYQTNAISFAACDCKAGWEGIACTDGRKALSYRMQLTMTLLLTLSNIIFLPCSALAIKRKFYTEALVYFFVAFFSSFYHACDEPGSVSLCIMKYDTLQYSDFLGSNVAFWITIIAIASLPFALESFFHVAGIMLISVAVDYNRFSIWVTVVPILVGLAILAFKWGSKCRHSRKCYPPRNTWLFSLVPGTLCAIIGLVLYGVLETAANYYYVHSLWHIFMGTSILFLIPQEKESFSWSLPSSSRSSSTYLHNSDRESPVMLNSRIDM